MSSTAETGQIHQHWKTNQNEGQALDLQVMRVTTVYLRPQDLSVLVRAWVCCYACVSLFHPMFEEHVVVTCVCVCVCVIPGD